MIDTEKVKEAYTMVKACRKASIITGSELTSLEMYMFDFVEYLYQNMSPSVNNDESSGLDDRYNAC